MSGGIRVDFDLYSDERVVNKLTQLEQFGEKASAAVIRAVNRAVRKVAKWMEGRLARDAYRTLTLRRAGLLVQHKRLKLRQPKSGQAYIWVGTGPMPAHYFRNPQWRRKWPGGARFTAKGQRQQVAGSFMGRYGNVDAVLIRKTSKAYPIKLVTVPVHDEMDGIVQRLMPQAREQFVRIAERELNYELLKLQKRV